MVSKEHRNVHSHTTKTNKDRRMAIDHLLQDSSSKKNSSDSSHQHHHHRHHRHHRYHLQHEDIRCQHSINQNPDHSRIQHNQYNIENEPHSAPVLQTTSLSNPSRSQYQRSRIQFDPSSSIITARREFAVAITKRSSRKGYLECKLCDNEVWGPNGRYHIDKCPALKDAREMARSHSARLTSVAGISVHPDVFKSTRKPKAKLAKVPGFVMSHSVSVSNPHQALSDEDIDAGMRRGRKGYVRCLSCNSEVFAPNARYHASHCERGTLL